MSRCCLGHGYGSCVFYCLYVVFALSLSLSVVHGEGLRVTVKTATDEVVWDPETGRTQHTRNPNPELFLFSPRAGRWFCLPDPETELLHIPQTRNATIEAARNERLLSRLGIPFSFDMSNEDDLLCYRMQFIFRDTSVGLCPSLDRMHGYAESGLYFTLLPEELEAYYGEQRLRDFELTKVTWHWDALDRVSTVGTTLHTAEDYVASLPPAASLLGSVRIKMPPSWGGEPEVVLPLADMGISWPSVSPELSQGSEIARAAYFAASAAAIPLITFDGAAQALRILRQRRVLAKRKYAQGVSLYNNAVRQEVENVVQHMQGEVVKAQKEYETERRRRESYELFMAERQRAAQMERKRAQQAGTGVGGASALLAEVHRITTANQQAHQSLACFKLTKALETLRRSGIAHSGPREQRVMALLSRNRCETPSSPRQTNVQPTNVPGCSFLCDAIADIDAWQRRTGQFMTVPQGLALVLSLRANVSSDVEEGLGHEMPSSFAAGAVETARAWLSSGHLSSCACDIPQSIRAELQHTTAIMELLHREGGAAARGVLLLQQAAWDGSEQAASALSTLREHGIFIRQNVRAALLLLSGTVRHVSSSFFRNLWRSKGIGRSDSGPESTPLQWRYPERARLMTAGALAERAARLLRQERPYDELYSWKAVDFPMLSRSVVDALTVFDDSQASLEDEENTDGAVGHQRKPLSVLEEEEEEAQDPGSEPKLMDALEAEEDADKSGRLTSLVGMRRVKALLSLHGLKTPLDVRAAECDLLTVLRKFDYLCDLHLLSHLSRLRSEDAVSMKPQGIAEDSEIATAAETRRMREVCPLHVQELERVLDRPPEKRFQCAWTGSGGSGAVSGRPPFPVVRANFEHLQSTLTLLGYLHLATGDYRLASVYARLSIDLAASVFQYTERANWRRVSQRLPLGENRTFGMSKRKARRLMARWTQRIRPWWVRDVASSLARKDADLFAFTLTQYGRSNTSSPLSLPFSVTDTALAVAEQSSILATAVLLDNSFVSDGEENVSVAFWNAQQVLQDAFRLPRSSLRDLHLNMVFETPARATVAEERSSDGPPLGRLQANQQVSLLLLLGAVNQGLTVFDYGHVLDNTERSTHGVDPFVLTRWLLTDINAHRNEYGDLSISRLRALRHELRSLVGVQPCLPLAHDTPESFSLRLLRAAAKHVYLPLALAEAVDERVVRVPSARQAANEDAVGRTSLDNLRWVHDRTIDKSHFLPLLFASDIEAYLTRTRDWTYLKRFGDAVMNALYYPFTETKTEELLRQYGKEILSPSLQSARSVEQGSSSIFSPAKAHTTAAFVQDYLQLFEADSSVRAYSIAVQLLASALESGRPQGFSLVFLEASQRGNVYLRPVADYLAEWVWGPATAAMWMDEHLTAQWHVGKPHTRTFSSLFAQDHKRPFAYSHPESRQELMGHVDRWKARSLLECSDRGKWRAAQGNPPVRGESSEVGPCLPPAQRREKALTILSRCAGVIPEAAIWRMRRGEGKLGERAIPAAAFNGMLFPAADGQCQQMLLELLQQMADTSELNFTAADALEYAHSVVKPQQSLLAAYYHISSGGDRRELERVPDSLEDAEGSDAGARSWKHEPPMSLFLVEPWKRSDKETVVGQVGISLAEGEGSYYFGRLHTVSGSLNAANLHEAWLWLKSMLSW